MTTKSKPAIARPAPRATSQDAEIARLQATIAKLNGDVAILRRSCVARTRRADVAHEKLAQATTPPQTLAGVVAAHRGDDALNLTLTLPLQEILLVLGTRYKPSTRWGTRTLHHRDDTAGVAVELKITHVTLQEYCETHGENVAYKLVNDQMPWLGWCCEACDAAKGGSHV